MILGASKRQVGKNDTIVWRSIKTGPSELPDPVKNMILADAPSPDTPRRSPDTPGPPIAVSQHLILETIRLFGWVERFFQHLHPLGEGSQSLHGYVMEYVVLQVFMLFLMQVLAIA